MMQQMLERAHETEDQLKNLLKEQPQVWAAVHGATLEVDEFWSRSFAHRYFGPHANGPFPTLTEEERVREGLWRSLQMDPATTPTFTPEGWETIARTASGVPASNAAKKTAPSPYRMRVWLKHPIAGNKAPTRVGDMPIVYEVREPLVAADLFSSLRRHFSRFKSSELSVGCAEPVPTAGTLGGYLYGEMGQIYLISCSHVLGAVGSRVFAPGPFEDRPRELCGLVRESIAPVPGNPLDPCDNQGLNAPFDIAAAELLPGWRERLPQGSLARILRPRNRMINHQPVYFMGKVSGYVEAEVGPALTLWAQIRFPDKTTRCMGPLFEIVPPLGALEVIARPGDSGAWVCDRAGETVCWDGVLVGSHSNRAYCIFAETAKQALDATLGATRLA